MSQFTEDAIFPLQHTEGYFKAETAHFNLITRRIPKYDLKHPSFTNAVSHPMPKYYSNMIFHSTHELGSLQWEIEASPIH